MLDIEATARVASNRAKIETLLTRAVAAGYKWEISDANAQEWELVLTDNVASSIIDILNAENECCIYVYKDFKQLGTIEVLDVEGVVQFSFPTATKTGQQLKQLIGA